MDAAPKASVLIFRLGSIGDTIVALPCFRAVARAFPGYRRVLLTNALTTQKTSSAESILDGTGLIDDVIYYPVDDFSLRTIVALVREVRRLQPVALIYLAERGSVAAVYRDLAFFKIAGVPRIIGTPWNKGLLACKTDPSTLQLEYESQRLARTLSGAVAVCLTSSNWDLALSAAELAKADAMLGAPGTSRRFLAIAPGAKVPAKDWGPDNWAELLKSIASIYQDVVLVLIGSADERELCNGLARYWLGQVVNVCGILTPRETAAALRRCDLLVCHDSGPMHLASSQQTRCVALFGSYNQPRQWYPFGDGHRVVYEPRGVQAIPVARVASEMHEVLAAEHSRRATSDARPANC